MAKNNLDKNATKEELALKIKNQAATINDMQKRINNQKQKVKESLNQSIVGQRLASIESILGTNKDPEIKLNLIEGYLRDE